MERKENWRALKKGMRKEEVRCVLGEPDRINTYWGFSEEWQYGPLGTGAEVRFPDGEGTVNGWNEPF